MTYGDDTRRSVEAAAENEKNHEQARESAEASWRAAWWQTTLALAVVPGDGSGAVERAYETAGRILGVSRDWLRLRRRTGNDLMGLEYPKIISLPPRLAVEYVKAGGDPARAVEYLTGAEARGVSLRDLAAELGTQPASWQREGERTPETEVARLTPERKAEVARELLSDPEVANAAFNRPDQAEHRSQTQQILANVATARMQAERERLQRRQDTQSDTSRHVNKGLAEAGAKLTLDDALLRYKRACAEFRETIAEALPQAGSYGGGGHPMSLAGLLAETRGQHALAGTALDALGSYVSGAASMDAELAKIMDGDR